MTEIVLRQRISAVVHLVSFLYAVLFALPLFLFLAFLLMLAEVTLLSIPLAYNLALPILLLYRGKPKPLKGHDDEGESRKLAKAIIVFGVLFILSTFVGITYLVTMGAYTIGSALPPNLFACDLTAAVVLADMMLVKSLHYYNNLQYTRAAQVGALAPLALTVPILIIVIFIL